MPCDELEPLSIQSGPPGRRGATGAPGADAAPAVAGKNAFTATTETFVMPAAAGTVAVSVADTEFAAVGQALFIETAGYFTVTGIPTATSFSLTAQAIAGNAAASTVIATAKRVTPAGFSVVDPGALSAIDTRITNLEGGLVTDAGNKVFYSPTAPVGAKAGDIWFDTDNGNRIYVHDGSGWVDRQRVLESTDFGLGIEPVKLVDVLPNPVGYTGPSLVFLSTDSTLYRYTGSEWTKAVNAADILGQLVNGQLAANSVAAGQIQAGAISADKVGANQIIATSANIADGIITSAKISDLAAGKISAGDIGAINIAHTGRLYNVAHVGNYFRSVEMSFSSGNGHLWGVGNGFSINHVAPASLVGPGNGAYGGGIPTFNPDAGGNARVFIQGAIMGYTGLTTLYYRKNDAGSYLPLLSQDIDDGGLTRAIGFRVIGGLLATDKLSFYIAPSDGNGDIAAPVTARFELDVTVFNW